MNKINMTAEETLREIIALRDDPSLCAAMVSALRSLEGLFPEYHTYGLMEQNGMTVLYCMDPHGKPAVAHGIPAAIRY